MNEFIKFLKEFNVLSLAIGFIMGAASTNLTGSLVKDILMPIMEPLMAAESWRTATLDIGSVHIAYGSFLAELINFVVLAFVMFIIVRKLLKLEIGKK